MLKGKALQYGQTIGIVALSSIMETDDRTTKAINKLEEMGFNVKVGKSCYAKYGYLAGEDEIRANDLNLMFSDKSVDAIICLKGGYGSMRILDLIDFEIIKNNPKIFMGYSDVTALHIAINKLANLITFHGPMLIGEFERGLKEHTLVYLKSVLSGNKDVVYQNPTDEAIITLIDGVVEGEVIGGNLTLIASTLGTKYEIDTKDKILFIEDVNEAPYRIDRMLTQLKLANKFADCKGIILGDFNNCVEENSGFETLDIIKQIIVPFNKPTIYNLQSGHCSPNMVIPFGVNICLDATNKQVILKENSCCK